MNFREAFRNSTVLTVVTFVLTILITLVAETFLQQFPFLTLSFFLLLLIIIIGIIFDLIGIAAAAADEVPFHAQAAKKVTGARQALYLIRHSAQVASFCNDLVGDLAGIVSGALGASIVFRIIATRPNLNETILAITLTASIAALTVGGKALGKGLAIHKANQVIFQVGKLLAWVEKITSVQIVPR